MYIFSVIIDLRVYLLQTKSLYKTKSYNTANVTLIDSENMFS